MLASVAERILTSVRKCRRPKATGHRQCRWVPEAAGSAKPLVGDSQILSQFGVLCMLQLCNASHEPCWRVGFAWICLNLWNDCGAEICRNAFTNLQRHWWRSMAMRYLCNWTCPGCVRRPAATVDNQSQAGMGREASAEGSQRRNQWPRARALVLLISALYLRYIEDTLTIETRTLFNSSACSIMLVLFRDTTLRPSERLWVPTVNTWQKPALETQQHSESALQISSLSCFVHLFNLYRFIDFFCQHRAINQIYMNWQNVKIVGGYQNMVIPCYPFAMVNYCI